MFESPRGRHLFQRPSDMTNLRRAVRGTPGAQRAGFRPLFMGAENSPASLFTVRENSRAALAHRFRKIDSRGPVTLWGPALSARKLPAAISCGPSAAWEIGFAK